MWGATTSSAGQNNEALRRPLHVLCAGWTCRNRRFPLVLIQEPDELGRKGGDTATKAPALAISPERAALAPKERIYVGLDIGYREHVAAASPLSVFNVGRSPDGWKRVKPIHFDSDSPRVGRSRARRALPPPGSLPAFRPKAASLRQGTQQSPRAKRNPGRVGDVCRAGADRRR